MNYRLLPPTPDNLARLWRAFFMRRSIFPDGFVDDMPRFMEFFAAPTTAIIEIGEMQGVVYFSDILLPEMAGQSGESVALVHIFIWDRQYLGKPEFFRGIFAEFMDATGVHRLLTETPADNALALHFDESVGAKRIGRLRQRTRYGGVWKDTIFYDALREDLSVPAVVESAPEPTAQADGSIVLETPV